MDQSIFLRTHSAAKRSNEPEAVSSRWRQWHTLALTALLLAMVSLPLASAQSDGQGTRDLILIVDTSKSMVGVGGTEDIFAKVRGACKDLVNDLGVGDTVTLIPYGTTVNPLPTVTLHGETERMRVHGMVDGLSADQNWTFTALALQLGLKEAERLEKIFRTHHQIVVILTDGLNDPPPGEAAMAPQLDAVAKPYKDKPWYVYQVQLGSEVDPGLQDAVATFERGETIHDPEAANIGGLREKIASPEEPRRVDWSKSGDLVLRLNEVGTGESVVIDVQVPEVIQTSDVVVELESGDIPEKIAIKKSVISRGESKLALTVDAVAKSPVPNSTYNGTVVLRGRDDTMPFEIPLRIRAAMVPPVWPYWLAGFVLVGLLLGGFFVARSMAAKRRLFGQLEAWPKDNPKQVQRFRDLSVHGGKASLGGPDLQLPGVAKTLGVLSTVKSEGERHVCVYSSAGEQVKTNGRTYDEIPLYHNDEFELGDWMFRYRGGSRRRR